RELARSHNLLGGVLLQLSRAAEAEESIRQAVTLMEKLAADVPAAEPLTLRGHKQGVSSLALSVDGKRLFSGSGEQTIKEWDVETGKEIRTLHGHPVISLALSADGKRLFSCGIGDTAIKVWDLETGKEALTLSGNKSYGFSRLVLSADGTRLFAGNGPDT